MPHHNRARLAEISEKGLNPNKKYVTGKHGNLIDPSLSTMVIDNEVKKLDEILSSEKVSIESSSTNSSFENLQVLDVEKPKETLEEDLNLDKQEKSYKQEKKKSKTKTSNVLESKS